MIDPGGDPLAAAARARADGRPHRCDLRHAFRRRPHRGRRRPGGRDRGGGLGAVGRDRRAPERADARRRARAAVRARARGRGWRRDHRGRDDLRGDRRPGPLGRPRRVRHGRGDLLGRPALRRTRSGASTSSAATGRRCSTRSGRSIDRVRPRRRRLLRATARRRRSGASSTRTRSSPSCAPQPSDREVPGAARDARRPAVRAAAVVDTSSRTIEEQARALRLRPHPDAGLRGHRALRSAPPGEASDVVTKEMYTFTDRGDRSLTLRPEGTAPIVPRLPRARPAPRAAAGEALHDRADVPLRPRRRRAATASTGSSRSRRSARPTRRSTPR